KRRARGFASRTEAAPDVDRVFEAARISTSLAGVLSDLFDHGAEAPWRHPDSQPAIAESSGTPHGGLGTAPDDDRDRWGGRRHDPSMGKGKELAVEAHWPAVGQRTQDLKGLIHSTANRRRIHTADLEFVPVLTTDPHAQRQPPRCQLGDAGELPRYQHRMTQR